MRHHFQNKLIAFLCLCAIHSASYAQTLDYSAYSFPEVNYRTLSFNENLNLGNNYNTNDHATRFSNELNAGCFNYTNKGNRQHIANRLLFNNVNLQSAYNSFSTIFISDELFRKYSNGRRFFEYGYDGSVSSNIRSKSNQYNNLYTGLNIPLKVGIGRIDALNEVMLAEFIIDDLKKAGILTDSLSQQSIFALAQEIAKFSYTRILDSRNYRLQVIKGLSNWIKTNLPVREDSEIELTSILIDNYLSSITGFRTIGSRLAIGINPNAGYSRYFKEDRYTLGLGGTLSIEYSVQKPISRYLQSNMYGIINLGWSRNETNSAIFSQGSTSTSFGPSVVLAYKLGYYPNSRTNVDITAMVNYSYTSRDYSGGNLFDNKRSGITPKIFAQTSYFMNYKLRLFANFEVLYFHDFYYSGQNSFVDDYVPDDLSYDLTNWNVGRRSDPSLNDRNTLHPVTLQNRVSYGFNAGFVFNLY